ncbi:MAG: hypothetical protein Q9195_009649 [Heterodermia aff. obscurata]
MRVFNRPLHGLPVLIKGNIGTRDRMQTNAGSYALQDTVLPGDSTVVAKLRNQGLIILGKASLTEWSMFRSSNSSHGWNAVCGQMYSAYYPKQCPGGSSGGSAVASDLGLAWATLGTETDGSIVIPSERNNIVGIKPTVGLTSRYLVVPVSEHQDTIGPMTRTVKDGAKLLQIIAGPDPNDPYTSTSPFQHQIPNYLAACTLSGLHGKRIGIAHNVLSASADKVAHCMPAFEHALTVMTDAGATIIPNTDFTAYTQWKHRAYNPVTRMDFVSNLATYLSSLEKNPKNIRNIEDLRRFTRAFPVEEYPERDTRNWDTVIDAELLSNSSPAFEPLYRQNLYFGGEGGLLGALQRHSLDAVVLPTVVAASIPALVGTPVVSVPLGAAPGATQVEKEAGGWDVVEMGPGVPFGVSFLGAKWSEEVLLGMAYAFEQRTLVRRRLERWVCPRVDLGDVVGG